MSREKNNKTLFEFRKTTKSAKHNKKAIIDGKEVTDQSQYFKTL